MSQYRKPNNNNNIQILDLIGIAIVIFNTYQSLQNSKISLRVNQDIHDHLEEMKTILQQINNKL